VAFYLHAYSHDRGYLITESEKYYYTTDTGKTWLDLTAPLPPNGFALSVLHFHPLRSDYLIWLGQRDCEGFGKTCHVEAFYTQDNGRHWYEIDTYVRNCNWARDQELRVDTTQILCESYQKKTGNQRFFQADTPLELISGSDFYRKRTKLFDHIVGFAKFSEFLIVAEVSADARSV
jgi:hypothetical protein